MSDIKPGTLKEAFFLRKVAKALGLKRTAPHARVLLELQKRVAGIATKPGAPADGEIARTASDLDAMLRQIVALKPVNRGLKALGQVAAVRLSDPLEAARAATRADQRRGMPELDGPHE